MSGFAQEHLIIFRASVDTIFKSAGIITRINDFSSPEPQAQVKCKISNILSSVRRRHRPTVHIFKKYISNIR